MRAPSTSGARGKREETPKFVRVSEKKRVGWMTLESRHRELRRRLMGYRNRLEVMLHDVELLLDEDEEWGEELKLAYEESSEEEDCDDSADEDYEPEDDVECEETQVIDLTQEPQEEEQPWIEKPCHAKRKLEFSLEDEEDGELVVVVPNPPAPQSRPSSAELMAMINKDPEAAAKLLESLKGTMFGRCGDEEMIRVIRDKPWLAVLRVAEWKACREGAKRMLRGAGCIGGGSLGKI